MDSSHRDKGPRLPLCVGGATFSFCDQLGILEDPTVRPRAEVLAACAELAPFKRVKKFTICGDEFPKTTTRKIKRFVVESDILPGIAVPLHTNIE